MLSAGNAVTSILEGGAGADRMLTRSDERATDITYLSSPSGVSLELRTGRGSRGDAAGDRIIGEVLTLSGSSHDDRIHAPDNGSLIYGHGGDDVLTGGRGEDSLDGGKGDNVLRGGAGDDGLNASAGNFGRPNNYFDGGPGTDSIEASRGTDRLFGGPGRDRVYNVGPRDLRTLRWQRRPRRLPNTAPNPAAGSDPDRPTRPRRAVLPCLRDHSSLTIRATQPVAFCRCGRRSS